MALGLFYIALILSESIWYTVTGHAVSAWAIILASIVAVVFFSPLVHWVQRFVDRMFFRGRVDTLNAIRRLGVGDLARLPHENVEVALLERICDVTHRKYAALDERKNEEGAVFCFPKGSPLPPENGEPSGEYELVLTIERQDGPAWLYLSERADSWLTEEEERESLESLARFAAMSLEHARLSHSQAQAARLDSIARVTSQLNSHDLKNRLNDLAFLAHHLEAGKLDEQEMTTLVTAVRKVVGRMQVLIQRMADPNAPVKPRFAPLDLSSMLRRQLAERLWPEGIVVHQDIPELPAVSADAMQLQGVFENLFDNAVQAMQKQGRLFVSAAADQQQMTITIRDTGEGMSEEFVAHRLFRLFSTSKESGLGIGLYLSRRIIEAHGGSITAWSEGKGKGSTFSVVLPLWQANINVSQGGRR